MKSVVVGCILPSGEKRKYLVKDTEKPYTRTPCENSPEYHEAGGIVLVDPDNGAYITRCESAVDLMLFAAGMRWTVSYCKEVTETVETVSA